MPDTDPVTLLREAARLMRERAAIAKDLTEDGHGEWFPWEVIQQTRWEDWPEPRPVPVPFAFDDSTEMAAGCDVPTGEAFVANARWAHDQEEAWHECEFIAGPMPEPLAGHIASWHPGVALAVADWLDARAAEYDEIASGPYGQAGAAFVAGDAGGDVDPVVRLARTYLGRTG